MINVSVIVPVYNTSKYLDKCLKSLVNQTLDNIEIIVINDGSSDNSMDIINKYKNKHSNIVVINKKNNGVSSARNDGIKIAKGKYVGFVDSDDYVDINMFKYLFEISGNFDMIVCDLYSITNNKQSIMLSGLKESIEKSVIKKKMNFINSTLCNKIYKTSILKNNLFTENMQYEDVEFLYRLISKINSINVVKKPLYYYNNRDNSKTHTYNKEWYKLLDNLDIIINYYKRNNLYNQYSEELEFMYIKYSLGTFLKKMSKCNYNEFVKSYNYVINKIKKKYPNYKRNKYLNKISLRNIYFKTVDMLSKKLIYKFLTKYM